MARVIKPSRMKIQAQPDLPPIPSISIIPRARRPPKAPAAVAAEKKIACPYVRGAGLEPHQRLLDITNHSETALMSSVPPIIHLISLVLHVGIVQVLGDLHCDVERHSRKQSTLCDTQRSTSGEQSSVVRDKTHKSTAYPPGDHDGWDPDRRRCPFHH